MKLVFLGGADEVGGSSLLVELAGRRILIDAGIRPSPKTRWGLSGDQLPHLSLADQAGGVDAVLVTHAHLDHTGALELIAERFPGAPIYASAVTLALSRVLHQDARRIMQSRLDEEGELPLFDEIAVERLMAACAPVPFNTRLPLGEGVIAMFYPAGHIAGAAMVGLHSDEGSVLVSGDISISPQRTVDGAKPPPFRPDVLVLESTYGGRLHANRAVQEKLLVKAVREVVENGGKALIPAFALGRAQELLLILDEHRRQGELPPVPVWADGMVRAICQAYSGFPEILPLPLQERGSRFFNEHIRPVETRQQQNDLIWQPEPAVIVSSSGMLAGGPAVSYARALAGQPQHAIFLTGYQDEESPGRRLQEMAERGHGALRLGKETVDVHCRLGAYALSAHADEGQLVSLAETLNPTEVVLVHGDDAARASLARSLEARRRRVHLPHAGQSLDFYFKPFMRSVRQELGKDRPLDIASLWKEVVEPTGGLFLLKELARTWWGEKAEPHLAELDEALRRDALYFTADPFRPALFRAQMHEQVDQTLQRRAWIAEHPALAGKWLALRRPGANLSLSFCTAVEADRLWVEEEDGVSLLAWPEDVQAVFGETPPDAQALLAFALPEASNLPALMEPNQALAYANQAFPAEARLRRCGYRLEQRILVLTFDFPDVAAARFAEQIQAVQAGTGWQVEINPETNLEALTNLARRAFSAGWQVIKAPSIYRQQRRVGVVVSPPAGAPVESQLASLQEAFLAESGYELAATLVAAPAPQVIVAATPPGSRMEINAAYAVIKDALANTTFYRASLKGEEIVLSFISRQVGERFQAEIEGLIQRTGWPMSINPQPNQGAILETTRQILAQAGWTIMKGPSLYLERSEVACTLADAPDAQTQQDAEQAVFDTTGFRLVINSSTPVAVKTPSEKPVATQNIVEIPLARIRLSRYQENLTLDPEKLAKTIERARRSGQVSPPLRVRRLRDGYLLLDGLYRLRAAVELGLERIWAEVE